MILCNLLRVPPIFIMDELFKSSFGLPDFAEIAFPVNNQNVYYNNTASQSEFVDFAQSYKAILFYFAKIIVSCLGEYK